MKHEALPQRLLVIDNYTTSRTLSLRVHECNLVSIEHQDDLQETTTG